MNENCAWRGALKLLEVKYKRRLTVSSLSEPGSVSRSGPLVSHRSEVTPFVRHEGESGDRARAKGVLEFELRPGETQIPGCTVEFCGTTLLPKRCRLRVGETLFYLTEDRIEVGGRTCRWIGQP